MYGPMQTDYIARAIAPFILMYTVLYFNWQMRFAMCLKLRHSMREWMKSFILGKHNVPAVPAEIRQNCLQGRCDQYVIIWH